MKKCLICFVIAFVMISVSVGLFGQNNFQFKHGQYVSTNSESCYIFIGSNNQFVEFWNWESIGDNRFYTYDPQNQVLRTYFTSNNELCSVNSVLYDSTYGREKLVFLYPDRSVTYYRKQQ